MRNRSKKTPTTTPQREEEVFTLDGELSIRNAVELRELLAEAANKDKNFVVDWGAVSDCDTAALQLIASFRKTVAARGRTVRVQGQSAAVSNLAQALGMPIEELNGASDGGKTRGL